MGSISDFLENELLDHIFNVAYSNVATVYLGLAESDLADDESGTETSYTGYDREAITFGAAASRVITQSGDVTFDQNTGSAVDITHWGIFDTLSGGDLLAHGAFSATVEVANNNTPKVATTEITVTVDAGYVSDYLADAWLDFVFRNQAFSKPETHIALATATLVDSDSGGDFTEVANANGYARKQVNINGGSSPTWDLAAGTSPTLVDNTHDVVMGPPSGGAWGTVVAMCVCTSGTWGAGEVLVYDNAVTDQAIGDGDTVQFSAGDLDISLT